MKLSLEEIPNLLLDKISRSPTIVYFGVGSEFNPGSEFNLESESNLSEVNNTSNQQNVTPWTPAKNQQFPLFLQNFKFKNPDVELLIVLIDPVISKIPFVVQETSSWYSGTFVKKSGVSNLFESDEFKITVCTIKKHVGFGKENVNEYSVFNMLTDCANLVIENDGLMFYHDFSGNNPSIASKAVSKYFQHLPKELYNSKICIDFSHGHEGDCFPSLDQPYLYPIISKEEYLIYTNPQNIKPYDKIRIFNKFNQSQKISDTSEIPVILDTQNISEFKINLFEEPDIDLLLYIQVKNLNKLEIESLKNSVFPILRQLKDTEEKLPDFEWALNNLEQLQLDHEHLNDKYLGIKELIEFAKNGEQLREIRQRIKVECYKIIEYFLIKLCESYSLDTYNIGMCMEQLQLCSNPYDMANIYKKIYEINKLI